jgi:hypothetical protein
MPDNKDMQKSGSRSSEENSSMDNMSDRDLRSQGLNQPSIKGTPGLDSSGGYGKDTGSQEGVDENATAGGRVGQFSDKNRGNEDQWSPGASGGPSDD